MSSSSIRVASTNSLIDDEFTLTVMDQQNYNRLTTGISNNYFKDLSSGPFNDESVEATCFSSSGTHMFAEGTVLYIIIRCTNEFFDCSLSIGIEHECVGTCDTVHCGFHGTCTSGKCVCDVGYTGNKCEIVVDRCGQISCSSHGTCINGKCHCNDGYTGDTCQQEHISTPNGNNSISSIVIAISVLLVAVLLIIGILIAFTRYRRRQHQQPSTAPGPQFDVEEPSITNVPRDILSASNAAYYESPDTVMAPSTATTPCDHTYTEKLEEPNNEAYLW